MSRQPDFVSDDKLLARAREVMQLEARSILEAADRLDEQLVLALRVMSQAKGKLVVTGLGKSGHIGKKIASTMSSVGVSTVFLHAAEALHGDLGIFQDGDVLLAIAYSGKTAEVLGVAQYCCDHGIPVIALTGSQSSPLAELATASIDGGVEKEACSLGLAPTSSSTTALALGDTLAMLMMEMSAFSQEDFGRFHPGGKLGRSLVTVDKVMRPIEALSALRREDDFAALMASVTHGNFGLAPVFEGGKLIGVVTDGDLRRALQGRGRQVVDARVEELMTSNPRVIHHQALAVRSLREMQKLKVTSLFVTDERSQVVGVVRMHDLLEANFEALP